MIVTVGLTLDPTELLLLGVDAQLSVDPTDVKAASLDFGLLTGAQPPLAVMHPASSQDAQTANGVVVQMSGSKGGSGVASGRKPPHPRVWPQERFVDVWGGELWIDVLRSTLQHGLAPKSWTDYLYLSVGGTLSNAGISGQAFNHGPQISNVHELDVVTGKGELLTCSEEQNSEMFHAVLGGLGQFGIITRARISLEPAPQRVRWIRVLYSNFSTFTRDQEYLISLHEQPASQKFDYVEGFVIVDEGLINNWRSSFFSPHNPVKISSLEPNGGVLYCLEIAKNYHESTASTIDQPFAFLYSSMGKVFLVFGTSGISFNVLNSKLWLMTEMQEVESLLKKLNFIPASVFTTDMPYVDFLDRVHKAELKLRSKGLWEVPHPWLNLFVPKSKIADFDKGVFKGILGNKTSGPILIYPMNKNK
ncbi:hypothetical protein Gotri_010354 [Gossypium trilobum]|uniref:cytokinin dehydrogenase n=1 Tax=Gossypium trilobum TaxID=34281 RepID=A0A7J9ER37_9ROSI|nr:hypothetical protein [Gossypium trilobum]